MTNSDIPQIEGYRVIELIGEGGMGTVWRAVQLSTDREVALKVIRDGRMSESARARFDREVRLAALLKHSNIATVYDAGEHSGHPFYAMKLVEGAPLDEFVQRRNLEESHIVKLMQIVCNAVQHAHQHDVVHRDLKPANILVTLSGKPFVLDFGLARQANGGDIDVTQTGDIAGTPAYMAPEQVEGRIKDIDARTDVFALGAILYYLLLGETPVDISGTRLEVLNRIANGDVRNPRDLGEIAPELEQILLKALAKELDDRYANAGELGKALQQHYDLLRRSQGTNVDEAGATDVHSSSAPAQRRPSAMIPLLIMLVVVVGAFFLIPRGDSTEDPPPKQDGKSVKGETKPPTPPPPSPPDTPIADPSTIFAGIDVWRNERAAPSPIVLTDNDFKPLIALEMVPRTVIVATRIVDKGRIVLAGHHGLTVQDPDHFNAYLNWLNPTPETRVLTTDLKRLKTYGADPKYKLGAWQPGAKLNPGDILVLEELLYVKVNDEHLKQLDKDLRAGARLLIGSPIWGWKSLLKLTNEQVRELWINRFIRPLGAELMPKPIKWRHGEKVWVIDEKGKAVKTIERTARRN